MSGIALPIDATGSPLAPAFPAADHRIAQAALMAPASGRPLGARSGFRDGAAPIVTLPTVTSFQMTPCNGVIDPGTALTAGPYLFAFKANETGAVNPADQNLPRMDRLDIQVPDEPAGASPRSAIIVYTPGSPNASPAAGLAAAPARSIPVGQILVPKATTGSPVFTFTGQFTVAAGGVLPVTSTAQYPGAPYVGQYVDDGGLVRWTGSVWRRVGITPAADSTGYPAGPRVGDMADDAGLGGPVRWDGTRWRALPLGYAGGALGPSGVVDVTASTVIVQTLVFPVVFGRIYRIGASLNGAKLTAAGTVTVNLAEVVSGFAPSMVPTIGIISADFISPSANFSFSPTSGQTSAQFRITAACTGGALRVYATGTSIVVDDIGN